MIGLLSRVTGERASLISTENIGEPQNGLLSPVEMDFEEWDNCLLLVVR
jgi:hypothetical protein